MKAIVSLTFLFFVISTSAQTIKATGDLKPKEAFDNIHVQKLNSDSLSTTFAIWVKMKVKMHKHVNHVENVYIIEGKGNFTVSDSTYKVKEGDLIVIPKDTWHGVNVTSKKTMKVISVQSPEFKGIDRIFKEK